MSDCSQIRYKIREGYLQNEKASAQSWFSSSNKAEQKRLTTQNGFSNKFLSQSRPFDIKAEAALDK